MAGGGEAALPVGGPDGGHVRARVAGRVHHHERDGPAGQQRPLGRVETGEHQDDTVRAARGHLVGPGPARGEPAGRLGQDDAQSGVPGHVLHTPDDLQRPGALQLVEDQVDQGRAGGLGAPAPVAVGAQQLLDPGAGGGGDIGAAVEDLRNSRSRYAGLTGDLGEGRRLRLCGLRRLHARDRNRARPLDEGLLAP